MKRKPARKSLKHPSKKTILPPGMFTKFIENFESIHPKLLDLAQHDDEIGECSPWERERMMELAMKYIKVPGHRGRHRDPKTLARERLVEEYCAKGLSLYKIAPKLGMTYNQLRAFVSKRKPRT